MSTILEVILKTAGFNEGATAIKKVGDEATNTNNKLKTTTSTINQVSKSTTSLGSKIKAAGSSFAQIGTAASTTVLSVVSLQRSYRDLEDSQIAVDKTTRRVSLAQEAYRKATDAVAKAIATGGKGSAAYKQALLDQQQALAKVNIALKDQGEAVERQGDINQNFWLSLGSTALSTSSTVVAALEKIGGEQGIGGIVSKLKGLGSIGSGGLGGLTSSLDGLSEKLKGATKSATGFWGSIAGTGVALGGGIGVAALIIQQVQQMQDAFDAAGIKFAKMKQGMLFSPTERDLGFKELDELMKKTGMSIVEITNDMEGAKKKFVEAGGTLDQYGNIVFDADKKQQELVKSTDAVAKSLKDVATAASTATPEVPKLWNQQASSMLLGGKAANDYSLILVDLNKQIFENTTATGAQAKALNNIPKAVEGIRSEFDRLPALDQDWFLGSWAEASDSFDKGFQDMVKTQADAAAKIKKDQQDAAAAMKAAWDAAFSAQVSGIDKMIAAFGRTHPTAKGFSPLGDQSQFLKAQAQMDKLLSGAVTKAPAYAKTFVTSFINQISQNMTPVAAQVFQPIIDYVTTHKNDAPDVFMKGFEEAVGKNSPTLATAMAGILDKGMVQPATTAAETTSKAITTGLGKVDITPLEEKMKLGAQAAGLITKGINKIPKKVNTTVNITANLAQANAKWAAFVRKVQMTTLQVKIAGTSVNIRKGSQAGAYGGPKQHGYQSTVHRPTMFIAGEGGRPEDVTVRPRGSVQRGGSGGGGFNGTINVYVDGVLRPARYDMGARK